MGRRKTSFKGATKKADDLLAADAASSAGTANDALAAAATPRSSLLDGQTPAPAKKAKALLHVEDARLTALRAYYGSGDWWFIQDYALAHLAASLAAQGWVHMDHFLSDAHAWALLRDVERIGSQRDVAGGERRFASGYLAGDGLGGGLRYSHSHVRGDEVGAVAFYFTC
jgi:hypothetical protein